MATQHGEPAWETVLAQGLSQRGVPPAGAALLGRVAVACHGEAMARWLAPDKEPRALADELDATFDQLSALVTNADQLRQ